MRIHAEVDVVNRQLAAQGMKKNGKRCKSQLAIGRKPLAEGGQEVFLMLSNLSNKAGVKYLIKDNVGNLFTRMIGEGKATIRFTKYFNMDYIRADSRNLHMISASSARTWYN